MDYIDSDETAKNEIQFFFGKDVYSQLKSE